MRSASPHSSVKITWKFVISTSNDTQDSAAMVALGGGLKHCHLQDLILSFNHIGCDGACSIASSFSQHLCKLHIKSCDIGVEGCKAIAKALHHCINLSEFDISYNYMPQSSTVELAEALKHSTKLCKLDISCNNLGSEGAEVIAHSLSHCTCLEILAIRNTSLGCNGACFLARYFNKYESLFKLDISCNDRDATPLPKHYDIAYILENSTYLIIL